MKEFVLLGWVKLIIVILVLTSCIILIYHKNWFQALVLLNISMRYRDFIEFFSDFDDEVLVKDNIKQDVDKTRYKIRKLEKFSNNDELLAYDEELLANKLLDQLSFYDLNRERNKKIAKQASAQFHRDDMKVLSTSNINDTQPWWESELYF